MAVLLAFCPAIATATADEPEIWRVAGVGDQDSLNARTGPGTQYQILATLPHDARQIRTITCVPTVTQQQYFAMTDEQVDILSDQPHWCLVAWHGKQLGWVNASFLVEDED
ncbi:hypothetical protein RA27_22160 [Ruegeria sp. ANG-R]|uniref:SH3 domain-containing protein n=1 Tax=Ruegeria sp. ANG-R TaxID=1577903 RepID=UPI00057D4992|nr:SH3 domain-containing protein [Ruegeria sp. ANG-R]KIC36461.1 hypothetical protein RA27_22160 [Ruegeria sp. ANG-R]